MRKKCNNERTRKKYGVNRGRLKNLTLSEISQKIDALVAELSELRTCEKMLMRQALPKEQRAETVLTFDDTRRTVSWFAGNIILSDLRYRLVKTLYLSREHRAEIELLAERVWQEDNETIPLNTFRSLVTRTNCKLQQQQCPYKIGPYKTGNGEAIGYELKSVLCNPLKLVLSGISSFPTIDCETISICF